jgi:hypothetical protein
VSGLSGMRLIVTCLYRQVVCWEVRLVCPSDDAAELRAAIMRVVSLRAETDQHLTTEPEPTNSVAAAPPRRRPAPTSSLRLSAP